MDNISDFKEIIKLSKDLKILYVEDDKSIREKTTDLLRNIFKEVDTACDGQEGMDAYKVNKYDLVITDIKMPKKDGRDLIKFIKEQDDMQAIAVTSAYNDANRLMELIELGISCFLLKPITSHSFFKTIHSQVKKINLRKLEIQNSIEQAKLAQMGEMMDSVAHQWKQPLTSISLLAQSMNFKLEMNGKLSKEEIFEINNDIESQTQHLLETINSFRSFFKPTINKDIVSLEEMVNLVKTIMKQTIKKNEIEIEIAKGKEITIECFKNEFVHVLINIVSNAKDAFIQRDINPKKIIFNAEKIDSKTFISIEDNAGGIDKEILALIFEQHFTTKGENGSGMGLYMSKRILDKIEADISVKNIETKDGKGVSFIISLS